jgi:FkbM family methyltransferase
MQKCTVLIQKTYLIKIFNNNDFCILQYQNMKFEVLLKNYLLRESLNYYKDNYDYYNQPFPIPFKKNLINIGKRIIFTRFLLKYFFKSNFIFERIFLRIYNIDKYLNSLNLFYSRLEDENSKELLLKIISFRIFGYIKVKLPLSTPNYWKGIKSVEKIADNNRLLELPYKPWRFCMHSLVSFNLPIRIFLNSKSIYTTFIIEQYKYQNNIIVSAQKGEVVFDIGGCYGDTALYFADKVGEEGKVFTFEFIPGNIDIINQNLNINPELKKRISLITRPVWEASDMKVFFKDKGSSSIVNFQEFDGYEGTTLTVSCDDFVEINKLEKIDFIKTDIEGAESFAIRGAERTIKKFKPKLAISIYHSMNDFVNIIEQIYNLNTGYRFYLGHSTIYTSETVLFCLNEKE